MKHLYIFLEGEDDKRYFKAIIEPLLKNKYKIMYYLYSQQKKEKIISFLKSIEKVTNWEYIFIADIDLFEDIKSKKLNLPKVMKF